MLYIYITYYYSVIKKRATDIQTRWLQAKETSHEESMYWMIPFTSGPAKPKFYYCGKNEHNDYL